MDYDELRTAVFSTVKDDDPYKESKQLQLENWCGAFFFLPLFGTWCVKQNLHSFWIYYQMKNVGGRGGGRYGTRYQTQ